MSTILGLFGTIFASCCMSGFISVKFFQMMIGSRPTIEYNERSNEHYYENSIISIDLKNYDFHIAFGVHTEENNYDPDLVMWKVYFETVDSNDKITEVSEMDYHECTDDDYDMFHDPDFSSRDLIEYMKSEETFYCIN